jgi:hypothetical protein
MIAFREALDGADVEAAIAAARAAGGLRDLHDILALLLVLSQDPDRARYDQAVERWLVHLQRVAPLPFDDRQTCVRALATLAQRGPDLDALGALEAVLVAHGQGPSAAEVANFRERYA